LFSQDPNGRNFVTGSKPARGDEIFHLVDDLQVDRDAVGGCDVNLHELIPISSARFLRNLPPNNLY
jgi:hypothetical protein